jgi:predicted nucleotidyltransferase
MNRILTISDIKQFTDSIISQFNPDKIILFGSYAWGIPTVESDIDLLVVMPFEGQGYKIAAKIMTTIGHPDHPVDILVRTPHEINELYTTHNCFFTKIIEDGITLYEKHTEA